MSMIVVKDAFLDSFDPNEVKNNLDYSLVRESIVYNVYSRILDIGLSLIGLIIGIPLVIIFGILIKLEDKGPIIYKQERVGKHGKLFNVYKLRSMRVDAEKYGAQWAQDNDPRILKVGNFIRKTRIDEIPQLFNILKGDMSIVGPRPIVEGEIERYGKYSKKLFSVMPGLTGYWQANGRSDTTYEERVAMDMYYIDNRSTVLDIKIIFKTFISVIKKEGAM